jgi:hypothetical protein
VVLTHLPKFKTTSNPKHYSPLDTIIKYIENNGGKIIETKIFNEYFKLPFPLNNKKVLGYGVLIIGIKN